MPKDMFYVYIYKDSLKVPRYVGKGTGSRQFLHWNLALKGKQTSNKRFSAWLQECVSTKVPPDIEVVFSGLMPSEAYVQEANLIKKYGRLGYESQGTLYNHSPGFEHFNIKNDEELKKKLQEIDALKHFNQKDYPEEMIKKSIELYKMGYPQRKIQQIIEDEFMKVTISMMRRWWVDAGLHIRTKSEMRRGELNPAFGRRGIVTQGFSGKVHSEKSKKKTAESLKKTWETKKQFATIAKFEKE